jgi:hypothetical protein
MSKQSSGQEAQDQFEKLVHVALCTPPKPQTSMEPKGVQAQRKNNKNKKPSLRQLP